MGQPGRKNLVSDKKVMELIDLIFNEIWRELDDGKESISENR